MKLLQNKMLATVMFAVVFAAATLFTAQTAHAATKTWQGASGASMASASNWTDNTAPQTGDTLAFPFGSVANNNLATNVVIAGISVTGTGETIPSLQINGNVALSMNGSIIAPNSGSIAFDTPVYLSGEVIVSAPFSTTYFTGELSGSGTLRVNNSNVGLFADNSQYSGAIIVTGEDGSLYAYTSVNTLGSSSVGTTISNKATLYFSTDDPDETNQLNFIVNEPITFTAPLNEDSIFSVAKCINGGICANNAARLSLNGVLTIPAAAKAAIYVDTDITKPISGGGSLEKAPGSTNQLTIDETQAPQGKTEVVVDEVNDCPYSIEAGYVYIIRVDCSTRDYPESLIIQNLGILKGTGKLMAVKIENGGTIAPGNSPGILSTGNLEFEKGGVYEFEMAGDEAGKYDQINVTGTVKLGDGTLKTVLLDKFTPGQGKSYLIINNDGADVVDGTFLGLAEGATVNVGDKGYFTISYKGGDGNDVTLTTLPGVGNAGDSIDTGRIAAFSVMTIIAIALSVKTKRRIRSR